MKQTLTEIRQEQLQSSKQSKTKNNKFNNHRPLKNLWDESREVTASSSVSVVCFLFQMKGRFEMNEIILLIEAHSIFVVLLYAVLLDTVLGVLRAIKEHKFNSCVGIDGAIRKVAMLFSVLLLMFIDSMVNIDFLFMIPQEYLQYIGITKMGICELFCLLFILYEVVSILKNMTLCGLPVPTRIKRWIQKFLDDMTEELPEEVTEELHKEVAAEGE